MKRIELVRIKIMLALCFILFLPSSIEAKSVNIHGLNYRIVHVTILNQSQQTFCVQGNVHYRAECLVPGAGKHPATMGFSMVTEYFYMKSGLFHYWFAKTPNERKMALVADHADEVDLQISPEGQLVQHGLNQLSGVDVQDYMVWHGVKPLLVMPG